MNPLKVTLITIILLQHAFAISSQNNTPSNSTLELKNRFKSELALEVATNHTPNKAEIFTLEEKFGLLHDKNYSLDDIEKAHYRLEKEMGFRRFSTFNELYAANLSDDERTQDVVKYFTLIREYFDLQLNTLMENHLRYNLSKEISNRESTQYKEQMRQQISSYFRKLNYTDNEEKIAADISQNNALKLIEASSVSEFQAHFFKTIMDWALNIKDFQIGEIHYNRFTFANLLAGKVTSTIKYTHSFLLQLINTSLQLKYYNSMKLAEEMMVKILTNSNRNSILNNIEYMLSDKAFPYNSHRGGPNWTIKQEVGAFYYEKYIELVLYFDLLQQERVPEYSITAFDKLLESISTSKKDLLTTEANRQILKNLIDRGNYETLTNYLLSIQFTNLNHSNADLFFFFIGSTVRGIIENRPVEARLAAKIVQDRSFIEKYGSWFIRDGLEPFIHKLDRNADVDKIIFDIENQLAPRKSWSSCGIATCSKSLDRILKPYYPSLLTKFFDLFVPNKKSSQNLKEPSIISCKSIFMID